MLQVATSSTFHHQLQLQSITVPPQTSIDNSTHSFILPFDGWTKDWIESNPACNSWILPTNVLANPISRIAFECPENRKEVIYFLLWRKLASKHAKTFPFSSFFESLLQSRARTKRNNEYHRDDRINEYLMQYISADRVLNPVRPTDYSLATHSLATY